MLRVFTLMVIPEKMGHMLLRVTGVPQIHQYQTTIAPKVIIILIQENQEHGHLPQIHTVLTIVVDMAQKEVGVVMVDISRLFCAFVIFAAIYSHAIAQDRANEDTQQINNGWPHDRLHMTTISPPILMPAASVPLSTSEQINSEMIARQKAEAEGKAATSR
jgi:hypothetical protein